MTEFSLSNFNFPRETTYFKLIADHALSMVEEGVCCDGTQCVLCPFSDKYAKDFTHSQLTTSKWGGNMRLTGRDNSKLITKNLLYFLSLCRKLDLSKPYVDFDSKASVQYDSKLKKETRILKTLALMPSNVPVSESELCNETGIVPGDFRKTMASLIRRGKVKRCFIDFHSDRALYSTEVPDVLYV